jgi:class 3 adenylate cyclase
MSVTPLRAVHALERLVPAVRAFRRALVPDAATPGPAGGAPVRRTLAVMFTDIEAFTALGERLGDERAQDVLRAHRVLVRRELRRHAGLEVKTQGDGFMLVFGRGGDAVRCAVAIQRATTDGGSTRHAVPIRVHVGIHLGPVLEEGGDFYGRTVVLAARLAAAAAGGEILVSEAVRDGTGADVPFDGGRAVALKGFSEERRAFAVRWGREATAAGHVPVAAVALSAAG